MDLLKLAAQITLDDSDYTKKVNSAEKLGKSLQGKMSAMTVAVGNLAADMMRKGVNAIGSVISGSINGYADYQQLIGGVETLFKDSSAKVAQYAKQSYKTTGLSANDYMETVTSFSASLLQGLGGNTEMAADLANTAITDMADNANKMGTDISSIQTAYQGFAKQNYTMLDNLKLGYGGTKEEMVRLINDSGVLNKKIKNLDNVTFDEIISAIHVVQTELGITGTTASEAAETISGSKASLKAAWEDMLSAVGGEGGEDRLNEAMANFKESFSTYMENFIPTLLETITSSGSLVTAIADAVSDLPTTLLSEVGEAGLDAGIGMVGGLSKITTWVIESITEMFKRASADPSQIEGLGLAVGDFIGTAISDIVKNAPAILTGAVNVGIALAGGLVQGLFEGLFGTGGDLLDVMDQADDEMNGTIKDAIKNNTKVEAIINRMDELVKRFGSAAEETDEWKRDQQELNALLPDSETAFSNYGHQVGDVVNRLRELNKENREYVIAEAKRRALKTKEEALINAQAELYETQSNVDIAKSEKETAQQALDAFFKGTTPDASSFVGMTAKQAKDYAYQLLNETTGGPGNRAYEESKPMVDAWIESITSSETTIGDLEGKIKDLESQVQAAQTSYLTSSAAIDNLTGAASGAAAALMAIRNPETTYNSGQYYNWAYSGGYTPGHGHATGLDYVPFDGYRAELHRGEAVVTAAENRQRKEDRGVSGDMENKIIAAIRAGMQNATVEAYINGDRVTDDVSRRMMKELKSGRYSG